MKETQEKKTRIVKMMQEEYSKNKKENGITLIALVITIIVLLIFLMMGLFKYLRIKEDK